MPPTDTPMHADTVSQDKLDVPTLEAYLAANLERGVIDHALRASLDINGKIRFYLHPINVDGATPQFLIEGNVLTPDDGLSAVGANAIDVQMAEVQAYSTNELPDAD